MAEEVTTIDQLAQMIKKGFDATATKTELAAFRTEVNDRLDTIDKRLDQIDRRLDHIENVVLDDHLQRIQAIEHALGFASVRKAA